MRRTTIVLSLLILLLLLSTISAAAMSSANYRIDWFTPATSGGGGLSTSTHYAANFTVGQSVIGASKSTNYGTGLGYWYGIGAWIKNWLPLILR
jgi:hypothetical protein